MSEKIYTILSINPGSTSTKVAVYKNETKVIENVIRHEKTEIESCGGTFEQKDFRRENVIRTLEEAGIELTELDAVVGRGGLIKPMESGTYTINDKMLADLQLPAAAVHASCLGGVIARELGDKLNIPSFIVDPIVVDELVEQARLSGNPLINRRSVFHALNHKSIARRFAKDIGKKYEDCRLVVGHLGGGISIVAHKYGRAVDLFDALSEGTFSPERCGGIPNYQLIELCFSGKYTQKEILGYCAGKGGMVAYLGINDLRECERMINEGDEKAKLVFDSMIYQISKDIGAMCAALEGDVDAIVLTGGLAYSERLVAEITRYVGKFAPVKAYPGEAEMLALTEGGLRVLRGEEKAKEYKG